MSTTHMVSRTHCSLKDVTLEMAPGGGPFGRMSTPKTGQKVRHLRLPGPASGPLDGHILSMTSPNIHQHQRRTKTVQMSNSSCSSRDVVSCTYLKQTNISLVSQSVSTVAKILTVLTVCFQSLRCFLRWRRSLDILTSRSDLLVYVSGPLSTTTPEVH